MLCFAAADLFHYLGPASHMQQQEDAFCLVLDAAADYVQLQAQLGAKLKQGHLQLAKARYAMGPGSVGSANYSSAMQATCKVPVSPANSNPFQLGGRSHTASSLSNPDGMSQDSNEQAADSWAPSTRMEDATPATRIEDAEDNASNTQAEARPDASTDSQSSHSKGLHVNDEYSSDAISELAAKFGTTCIDSQSPVKRAAPKNPLNWFGFMVSPHLRQSQADFKEAVTLLIDLANAQHRIHTASKVLRHHQDT